MRRFFFVGMALTMIAVVVLGFGKSFFFRPMFTTTPLPIYLFVHGVTMTAWYLLFLAQAILVSARRADIHRALGVAGLALAAAVVVTAVVLHLNIIPRAMAAGIITRPEDGLAFTLGSLSSLLPFIVLIAVAVAQRHKPEVHKRLMFWAFAWTLGPAFSANRPLGQFLDPLVAPYLDFFPADFLWLFALLAYDWLTLRKVHWATVIPFALLFVFFVFVTPWITENEIFGSWLLVLVENREAS